MSLQLPLGGLVPLSTVDWPGKLAAVLFTRGCPWSCPYCHNPHLRRPQGEALDGHWVFEQLARRVGFIDGVVFSGGEPTLHPGLAEAMEGLRDLGLECALHTSGSFPERLAQILDRRLVSWVGLDIKAPFARYPEITGREDSGRLARRSLELLAAAGIEYELRTTVWPEVLDEDALRRMAADLEPFGRGRWVLQQCRPAPPAAETVPELSPALVPVLGVAAIR